MLPALKPIDEHDAWTEPEPFQSQDWNEQAGKVAQAIGTPFFHEELIHLFELTIKTDASWIIRFAGDVIPDVLFTKNVPPEVRSVYSEECAVVDPFSTRWRSSKKSGVFSLAQLYSNEAAYRLYHKTFLAAAGMDDELGIFIPITEDNCFGILLEREWGLFQQDEIDTIDTLYPAIEQWLRAHLDVLFEDFRNPDRSNVDGVDNRPMMIHDHAGQHVYSSEAWNDAVRRRATLKTHVAELLATVGEERRLDDLVIRSEKLGPDFPLAPNGVMLTLERTAEPARQLELTAARRLYATFTRRERDVLRLALRGLANQDISRTLDVGVGSIRNVKTNLYRKSGVGTEGELVLKFLPFAGFL